MTRVILTKIPFHLKWWTTGFGVKVGMYGDYSDQMDSFTPDGMIPVYGARDASFEPEEIPELQKPVQDGTINNAKSDSDLLDAIEVLAQAATDSFYATTSNEDKRMIASFYMGQISGLLMQRKK